jgi:Uncharacterized protein with conserved CXXC pairs
MLCKNCNTNEATIHLYTTENGQKEQVDLCQKCYQELKVSGRDNLFGIKDSANDDSNQMKIRNITLLKIYLEL